MLAGRVCIWIVIYYMPAPFVHRGGRYIIISSFYIFFLASGKICLSLLGVASNENLASREV